MARTIAKTINVEELLSSDKRDIKVLNGSAMTGRKGAIGIGQSKYRPAAVKNAASFSGAAYFLDRLLVDHCINALETSMDPSSASCYVEFTGEDGKLYQAGVMAEDTQLAYTGEMPEDDFDKLIPLITFELSSAYLEKNADELRNVFKNIVAKYQEKGLAELADVLLFCDSFYYTFAKNHPEISVYEGDLSLTLPKQGYETGLYDFVSIFEDIEGRPNLDVLKGMEIRKSKRKGGKKSSSSDLFEDCKAGNHAIAYTWEDEDKQVLKIPSLESLNDFVATPHFYSLLHKIEERTSSVIERMDAGKKGIEALGRDYVNTFIIGKPGTGKTTIGYALGAALRMPVYTVAITKNTEEDTFQGMTKVVDGGFKFVDTDFLYAYTHGGIILLEEVNLADPSVIMGALGQAIEAPFVLMKDGYQAVRRHPLCIIIGTMNIGTYGAKGVSQAFSSRFKQTYILDDPKKEDFISILEKQGYSNARCEWVYNAYQRINQHLKSPEVSREEICLNVTLRGCIGALECMEEGDAPQQAVYNTLVGKVAEVDLELAEDIYKHVVKALPDLRA